MSFRVGGAVSRAWGVRRWSVEERTGDDGENGLDLRAIFGPR